MTAPLRAAVEAARAAGSLLRRAFRGRLHVRRKSTRADLVTEADHASERRIVGLLRRRFPDHDVIAEERARHERGSACRWLVDPLDGTVNFVHGLPMYSVSIALQVEGRIELGAVYAPEFDELFTAERTRGARRNGRPIRVSSCRSLADAYVATGFPYFASGRIENLKHFGAFLRRTQALRRLGSAALDLSYVACGIFDGYWELGLKAWDVAAGSLIVAEAAGRATSFDGGPLRIDSGEILASNGRIHRAMVRTLRA